MHHIKKSLATTALCALFTLPAVAVADDAPFREAADYEEAINYKRDTLTGDWGGLRTSLSEKGIDTTISYTFDVMSNVRGGINEGTRGLDNLSIVAAFDGEKLFGAKGTTAVLSALNNNGGRPEDLVGSAQGVNNIEVPKATGKLYEAWIQQNAFNDKLSILGGLYAVDGEFQITDSSGLFLHSTYGASTDFSQSGRNGPPIFPFSALGVRTKIQPTENSYFQVAVMDGVPGDANNPEGTQIELSEDEGALIVAEAGYTGNGKIMLGGWYYTEEQDDIRNVDNDGNPLQERSQGIYIMGERPLTEKLTGFARLGFADRDTNQFDYAWSAGLVYTGLIPTREDGQLGFAVAGAHNSSKFKQLAADEGVSVNTAETAFELTYSDNVTPWMTLQPNIQYIVNPGTDPSLDNALVLGLRTGIEF